MIASLMTSLTLKTLQTNNSVVLILLLIILKPETAGEPKVLMVVAWFADGFSLPLYCIVISVSGP